MSPLEIFGFVLGVIAVWLTARQHIWCWPTGIVSVIVYAVVFVKVKLYSDVALQLNAAGRITPNLTVFGGATLTDSEQQATGGSGA